MKYFLNLIFLISIFHFKIQADDSTPIYNAKTKASMQKEEQTLMQATSKELANAPSMNAKLAASQASSSDVMIIDPKIVASDWSAAFNSLKSKKLPDIIFSLRDNSTISDVYDVEPLPGGYLMLFTLRTPAGSKYKIVKTSDICQINSR